ncbi:DNA polymerase I [Terrarubrum flagellatum]|uniref:DNA polymerase I n=1 Tax=Terrirubrum flagellatum TaxID=2895980 RepID=UPI0031455481
MNLKSRPVKAGDHVFLVDGSSFVFRAYFQSMNQDRKYNTRSDGLPTGAVRLFSTKLLQFIREGVLGIKPTHLAIIFDKSENSFRKELYPDYKANRNDPPEELIPQFPLMREAVRAFGLFPVEQDRFEADDLIATYAKQARERGADALIISADKDLMQLVTDCVAFYDFESGVKGKPGYRPERLLAFGRNLTRWGVPEDRIADVTEKWEGMPPSKLVDIQALTGDPTDNVPGAPGIGLKTAAQLIGEYGDLDTLLKRAAEIKQPKRRETLTNPDIVKKILISRELVKLVDEVPLITPLDDLALNDPDPKSLIAFLKAMDFTTITRRVAELFDTDAGLIDADERLSGAGGWMKRNGEGEYEVVASSALISQGPVAAAPVATPASSEAKSDAPAKPAKANGKAPPGAFSPHDLAEARRAEASASKIDTAAYRCVMSLEELDVFIAEAREQGFVAFDTECTSLDPMQAELVGFSLATAPGRACYAPLTHKDATASDLFGGGLVKGQMESSAAIARLKPLLEDLSVLKIAHNAKFDMLLLRQHGIDVAPIDDTMLISYALDSGLGGRGMDELSEKHLGHKPIAFKDVAGSGRNAVTFDRVPLDRATAYAAEDADVTLRLWRALKPRLIAEKMTNVYETLERGMPHVLMRMEERGIAIDRNMLSRLSGDFAQSMARLEDEINELAGEKINPGSPKQIGDILFGKFGLPGAKKTATGQWSTGAGVLEDLSEQGHALPSKLLEWRQVSKLKSTYSDALPDYVNPRTHRVHTSFALAATTTGRLSSSEPNIQNIPIRTEEGRKIRRAFIATPGNKLVSADYSQIELRVLAHIAHIPQLMQAFADGVDIHAMTASEMFGVPVKGMDPMVRRRAKAINFGIIYGISAFGLANQLGIAREEAAAYIKKYFERFPGIRDYMDQTKKVARDQGFVTTIFGRKCHYPQIKSSNPSERAFMERAAINAPIQGSAADIIRRAMMRMESALAHHKLAARMLLQVHDELVFEVPDSEVKATMPVIISVMEQAPSPTLQLAAPLKVEARAADNWEEAH